MEADKAFAKEKSKETVRELLTQWHQYEEVAVEDKMLHRVVEEV